MKATIEFTLPEEQKEFNCCNKAPDMALMIWDLVYNAHKRLENKVLENPSVDNYDTIELLFEDIFEKLEVYGIIIDDLTE